MMTIEEICAQLASIADSAECMIDHSDRDDVWQKDVECCRAAVEILDSLPVCVPAEQALEFEKIRTMDGEPVFVVFEPDENEEQLKMWCLVENDNFGSVYLTNNLGGRDEFACMDDMKAYGIEAVYAREVS